MLSQLSLISRVRDVDYLDPQTWITFIVFAAIAAVAAYSLTRWFEWAVIALRNRGVGRWMHPDVRLPVIRRHATMLYGPAISGVMLGALLAIDSAGVGFYFAYDEIFHPSEWDWLGYAILAPLALFGLSLVTLLIQLVHLFGFAGVLMAPLYLLTAVAALAAGACGAPLVAVGLLAWRGALVDMPYRICLTFLTHLRGAAARLGGGAGGRSVIEDI